MVTKFSEGEDDTGNSWAASWPALAAFPLAAAVAAASLGGLLLPSTYANETASWAAEGIAQDWVDLVLVVPLLLIGSVLALRGRRIGETLLAGATLFAAYSFLIYGFAVHFNGLFLVYSAALGLSVFAFVGLTAKMLGEGTTPVGANPFAITVAAWFLVVVAVLFAALWLSAIVPANVAGAVPPVIVTAGLPTNPVYVIDLSLFLPGQLLVGISLLRRRPLGYALAPVLLAFGTIMAATLATIMIMSSVKELGGSLALGGGFLAFAVVNLAVLVAFLNAQATKAIEAAPGLSPR
jgi:hypothetical protein